MEQKLLYREALPASMVESRRWIQKPSFDKAAMPTGWNDPLNWKTLEEIPYFEPVAFMTAGDGGFYAVADFDHCRDEKGRWYAPALEVMKRIQSIAGTYWEKSQSGNGLHCFVDLTEYADNFDTITNTYQNIILWMDPEEYNALNKSEQDKIPKIELFYKTAGRYFLLTGDQDDLTGEYDEVAEAEEAAAIWTEFLSILRENHEKYGKPAEQAPEPKNVKQIDEKTREYTLSALEYIRSNDRNTWAHVGMALYNAGFDYSVWDEWSKYDDHQKKTPYPDYSAKETAKQWKSFERGRYPYTVGTIFYLAKQNGWKWPDSEGRKHAKVQTKTKAAVSGSKPSRDSLQELTLEQAVELSLANPVNGLNLNDKGIPKNKFENYVSILQRDAYLRGRLRFNNLDGRAWGYGFYWEADPHPIRDNDLSNIRTYICRLFDIDNKDNTACAIDMVAHDFNFHPVRERLQSIHWDGVKRLGNLFPRYLGAERSAYTEAVTLTLFHGLIQRVMNPGCKFDYCVILADTKQGTGKSTITRFLALNDDWFCDSVSDFGNDEKVFESLRGKWVAELGEMLVTRKTKDVESIKAGITRKVDYYRDKYGRYKEDRPRQCVFIGTSNRPEFLPEDKTGNRRFLPILCNGSRAEKHPMQDEQETRAYIEQCYGEAIAIGQAQGWQMVLPKEYTEQVSEIQEQATPEDTRIGLVQAWLDATEENLVCSRMIWDCVFAGAYQRDPQQYELRDISDIMNLSVTGWRKYKSKSGNAKHKFTDAAVSMGKGIVTTSTHNYGVQRAWERIPAGEIADKVADQVADGNFSGTNGNFSRGNGNQNSPGEGFEPVEVPEDVPF